MGIPNQNDPTDLLGRNGGGDGCSLTLRAWARVDSRPAHFVPHSGTRR